MPRAGFKHTPESLERMRQAQRAGKPSVRERFERNVEPDTNGGCWLWAGTLIKGTGYGQIEVEGRAISAHRLAYQLHKGPIPRDLSVLHRCDVRACCNPEHLFLGTHRDNMADMAAKGRAAALKGDDHVRGKITSADIPKILARLLLGQTCRQIAEDYGVTDCAINAIRRGKSWNHVTGLPQVRKLAAQHFDDGRDAAGGGASPKPAARAA